MPKPLCLIAAIMAIASGAFADSEIVVAIRYLQAEGASHSHLYLFLESGKFLRQLTKDDSGQDSAPIFAPNGETIIFTRELPNNAREFWSVGPRGANLKQLDATPDWYTQTKSSPYFTNSQPDESASAAPTTSESGSPSPTPAPSYRSPDGAFELALQTDPNDENGQIDGPGHGRHYVLRNLKTGTETQFGNIPGFYGAFEILHESQDTNRRFLFEGPLHLAFFGLHLNSTDGDTVFALDLTSPRFVRLSPNWATPIPLPGEAAFLTFTENRYVPIPGSHKTANCSYAERWGEKLNHIRYAREKTAAICNGFSMYRPGKNPAVITFQPKSQTEE